jgi:hypothetical protein
VIEAQFTEQMRELDLAPYPIQSGDLGIRRYPNMPGQRRPTPAHEFHGPIIGGKQHVAVELGGDPNDFGHEFMILDGRFKPDERPGVN